MEQHAIPQQISSYQFKLVGDMTLGQFGKAAGGIILAILVNASGMIFFVKYPLMLLTGGGGLLLAFVPFEDRPLETWIKAFFKSIYSPTIYTWKKVRPINWLDVDRNKTLLTEEDEKVEVLAKDENKIKEFIQSLPSFKREKGVSMDVSDEEVETGEDIEEVLKKTADGMGGDETKKDIKNEKQEVEIATNTQKTDNEVEVTGLNLRREKLKATGVAEFGGVPMPDTPTEPNVLSGMVIGPNDEIIEEAIVEVRDKSDSPVRVFKTNALGQFKTATPLINGNYLVITEKNGYEFDRVDITMTGKILEPIKIRAKKKADSMVS